MSAFFVKLAGLTLAERRFAAEAWLLAPVVELALEQVGLRLTLEGIDALTDRLPPQRRADARAITAARGAELVAAVYNRHLLRGQCLPRSLLQYALHRRAGRDVTLIVGVKPPQGGLEAHAWVADEGEIPNARGNAEFEPMMMRSSRRGAEKTTRARA